MSDNFGPLLTRKINDYLNDANSGSLNWTEPDAATKLVLDPVFDRNPSDKINNATWLDANGLRRQVRIFGVVWKSYTGPYGDQANTSLQWWKVSRIMICYSMNSVIAN